MVIVFAAYLALGRQFIPELSRFKPQIEVWLSERAGVPVTMSALSGEWVRFNPVVKISGLNINNALTVRSATLAPSIWQSITRGGLSFIRFELSNFQAELVQTDTGWALGGIPTGGSAQQPVSLTRLNELLKRQQQVIFFDSELSVKPKQLPAFSVRLYQGQLKEYLGENGLLATASVAANGLIIPIELQIQTNNQSSLADQLYLKHGAINAAPWLDDLPFELSTLKFSGEYWAGFDDGQWLDLTARINRLNATLEGVVNPIRIDDLNAEVFIENEQASSVNIQARVLDYSLNNQPFSTSHIGALYREQQVALSWDALPAQWVGRWLARADANAFWSTLSPTGFARDGFLTWRSDSANSLTLNADIDDFSMSPRGGVPGINGASGAVAIKGQKGMLSFSAPNSRLELPSVFEQDQTADIDQGYLTWQVEPEVGVYSQGVAALSMTGLADSDAADLDVWWQTTSPFTKARSQGAQSSLDLQISSPILSTDWINYFSNNQFVSADVASFLQSRLSEGEFVRPLLTLTSRNDGKGQWWNQFFLASDVSGLSVEFLDDWPALEKIEGQLLLTNSGVKADVSSANFSNFLLEEGRLSIDYKTNQLTASALNAGSIDPVILFLKSGPLMDVLGERLNPWDAQGEVGLAVAIDLPLSAPQEMDVNIEAQFELSELSIDNIGIELTDVAGALNYRKSKGLTIRPTTAKHLGLGQTIEGFSEFEPLENTQLWVQGQTPINYWGQRVGNALLSQQNAIVTHQSQISISPSLTRIHSQSDLLGWAFEFPEPYAKETDKPWPLDLKLSFLPTGLINARANVGESFRSFAQFDAQKALSRASIAVNKPLVVAERPGIYVDAQLPNVNGTEWLSYLQALAAANSDGSDQPSLAEQIKAVTIETPTMRFVGQNWQKNLTEILRNEEGWFVGFTSEEGRGQVLVPHDEQPLFADIEFLSITSEPASKFEDEEDPLLTYTPLDIPNAIVQVNKLIFNDRDLGSWRGEASHENNHLAIRDLRGNMNGAQLSGELVWQVDDGKHQTQFQGDIELNNVSDVLNTWEYAPVLTSNNGRVTADINWQGSPAFFDFKRIAGEMELTLNSGSILAGDEFEGVKLVGLLNFTQVLRRMSLDFSDLLSDGITFDSIKGHLVFDRGFVRVGEQLDIDGSATRFSFNGGADLLLNELDVDMDLVVPLSTTFPLVALLAGLSPQAAAAIFVTERVFNNQLERLSSARMHVTGAIEAPDVRFYGAIGAEPLGN